LKFRGRKTHVGGGKEKKQEKLASEEVSKILRKKIKTGGNELGGSEKIGFTVVETA